LIFTSESFKQFKNHSKIWIKQHQGMPRM
jgi:hypothetical protein